MPSRPSSFFTSSEPLPRLPITSRVVSSLTCLVRGSQEWMVPQPRPTFGLFQSAIGPLGQAALPT